MEFLRSLLRRRFAMAQVATSRNVGCFLRLAGNSQRKSNPICSDANQGDQTQRLCFQDT